MSQKKMKLYIFILLFLLYFASPENDEHIIIHWATDYLTMIGTAAKKYGTQYFLTPAGVARALAIACTCMYDAWSIYDSIALPYLAKNVTKVRVFTKSDVEKTISFALFTCIEDIFSPFPEELPVLDDFFTRNLSYSISDDSPPAKLGKTIAKIVTEHYHKDGMNQLGDEPGTRDNSRYSDYTNYVPVNPSQESYASTNCSKLVDINHWQPLAVTNRQGELIYQHMLTPQMGNTKAFALTSPGQFRPPPPPLYGTNTQDQFIREFREVLEISGTLDDRKKVIAEYWADGPNTTLPAGHFHEIALWTAIQRKLSMENTIKLLFLQAHAANDAGIATWDCKRWYDSARPISVIQCLFADEIVDAWAGLYQGVKKIKASEWIPYQAPSFVTPGFPEYVSGHSTFSAASAEVLKLFYGSDYYGRSDIIKEGQSLFEPKIERGQEGYIEGVTDVPNTGPNSIGYVPAKDIVLKWETFTEAAEESGISRLYGGIHIHSGNIEGQKLGRKVGKIVFLKAEKLFKGIATDQVEQCYVDVKLTSL